jgi:hypothetical protein
VFFIFHFPHNLEVNISPRKLSLHNTAKKPAIPAFIFTPILAPPTIFPSIITDSDDIAMNSITTPLTKTLPYFAQPYALFGAILHISMLYLVLCIGKYSRTPLTLRPIQHHLYTIFLCVFSSAASVIIVAVNALHTCRAIPMLNFVGYFIVNATVPVCFGVVTGCEALHGRRKVLAERAGADAPERGTSALAVAFYAYATGLTFGLLNLVWLVSQHWSMPPMKAFIITTVLCSVIVGIVILVASQQTAAAIVRTDRARWWCAGMGAFIFGVLPFLMDTALAISVKNVWGVPLGESVEVFALYAAYVVACALPLFSM